MHDRVDAAIIGGAGFIARRLLRMIDDERPAWRVRVVDDFSAWRDARAELEQAGVEVTVGDVRDAALCDRVVAGANVVFHMAAVVSSGFAADPVRAAEVNAVGSLNVIKASARAGARLILSSSCGVYGRPGPRLVDEASDLSLAGAPPSTAAYGASKLLAEYTCSLLALQQPPLDWVSLRYASVYGPEQHSRGRNTAEIAVNVGRVLDGKPPVFRSNPMSAHDYVYVDDVARANVVAAEAPPGALGQPYVIASGVSTLHRNLAGLLCELAGVASEPEWIGDEPPVVVRYDPSAASERLGWRTQVPLREGLSAMLVAGRLRR